MSATSQSSLEGQRPLVTDAAPGIGRADAFAPRMAATGHGSIASVSSMAGGRLAEDRGRLHPDRHEVS
jgi:hypothetical protein